MKVDALWGEGRVWARALLCKSMIALARPRQRGRVIRVTAADQRAIQMVAPLLQNDDYVIVEDTNLDGHDAAVSPGWGPSPYDAIVNFMAMNRRLFTRDLAREKKWGFTQSMNGFLIGD